MPSLKTVLILILIFDYCHSFPIELSSGLSSESRGLWDFLTSIINKIPSYPPIFILPTYNPVDPNIPNLQPATTTTGTTTEEMDTTTTPSDSWFFEAYSTTEIWG
ncbi:hypothetical protein ACKWTF_016347 [Chironomus riparius]